MHTLTHINTNTYTHTHTHIHAPTHTPTHTYTHPLHNMDFTHRTRVIAFADDLLALTQGKCALDTENYANQDLKKIENWARENKMHFNENKSKVSLVTTKTSGHNRTLNIYLNNKHLEQVSELKYLGIYFNSRFKFRQTCRIHYREMPSNYKHVSKIS